MRNRIDRISLIVFSSSPYEVTSGSRRRYERNRTYILRMRTVTATRGSVRWDDIAMVAAVVEAGSFLGAARQLGCEHSSVSRRIAAIEEGLGDTLFVRGRRLVATALARAIARHAAD